ncbi:MAG: hypothetical protein M1821_009720 [Bathelium mastoideum]|nr:MAG: hypothetical protein M1821_009720 [Bathelium mastoideum]
MPSSRSEAVRNRLRNSPSAYELQDLRKPCNMSSYRPPPPIAASSVALPIRTTVPPPVEPDSFLALHRQEIQLQGDLQNLLDAQADGLSTGLGNSPENIPEDLLSNGSSTPTASTNFRTSNGITAAEARRPKPKKVGLGAARRGLWKTIRKLASVKTEEASLINNDIAENSQILDRIDAWGQKREGLQTSIRSIEHGSDEGAQANNLRQEAQSLRSEIQTMESKLADMKNRHHLMLREVSRLENSIQAQLSSYRESLDIVETEVKRFLDRPPINHLEGPSGSNRRRTKDHVDGFVALPSKRRTLVMARSHWEDRRVSLEKRREGVEFEKEALEEGAVVWKDVVNEVVEFEGKLRKHMQNMDLGGATSQEERDGNLKLLLREMDQTRLQMESKLRLAEARDWRLLVCCIGAELEAFKHGREILEGALIEEAQLQTSGSEEVHSQARFDELSPGLLGQDPSAMTSSRESVLRLNRTKEPAYDTEDDEPDPELLISHQDTDASE